MQDEMPYQFTPNLHSVGAIFESETHQPPPPSSRDPETLYQSSHPSQRGHEGDPITFNNDQDHAPMQQSRVPPSHMPTAEEPPAFYRKPKACMSCRAQKIKCIMEHGSPPCRRCQRKKLQCVTHKHGTRPQLEANQLPFLDAVLQDLGAVHGNVQAILNQLGLPAMTPPQIGRFITAHSPSTSQPAAGECQTDAPYHDAGREQPGGPSYDNSPQLSPKDDVDLTGAPIRSMYHLTKLSALRSPVACDDSALELNSHDRTRSLHREAGYSQSDFILEGKLDQDSADRLFQLYINRLDHYMYGVVTSRYTNLSTMRNNSPLLTAAVLTVAAMHDAGSNAQYPVCMAELDRLTTSVLLQRRINRDHLRALCVSSYWLHDTSWVLSGVATRRATEFDVMSFYRHLGEEGSNSDDAADFLRVWYLIFICDQHLSTLYGRPCSGRQDAAITGWQALVRRSVATSGDLRLASQVALLRMIQEIRELFGSREPGSSATGGSLASSVFLSQIKGFSRQLDEWMEYWPPLFPAYQEGFGAFPRKGIQFHGRFAKLYLYSQAFVGLDSSPLPPQLSECAYKAVEAATIIIEMILHDDDVRAGLVGLPSYVQSMIGFACMSLTRLATLHGDLIVERSRVSALISRLKLVYEATPVGNWHLAYMMPRGLERILALLRQEQPGATSTDAYPHVASDQTVPGEGIQYRGNPLEEITEDINFCGYPYIHGTMAHLDPYSFMDSGMNLPSSQHVQHGSFGFFGQGQT